MATQHHRGSVASITFGMRNSKNRESAAPPKFDRLISALCQEHYDCLRHVREEGAFSQRLTTGSRLCGSDAGGEIEFWPQSTWPQQYQQSTLLTPSPPGHRRRALDSANVSVQSAESASASRMSDKSLRFVPFPNDEDRVNIERMEISDGMGMEDNLCTTSLTSSSRAGKYFELRLGWEQDWGSCPSTSSVPSGINDSVEVMSEYRRKVTLADRLVLHPNSRRCVVWNMLCFIFIVADIIFVPLQAFNLEDVAMIDVADWTSRSFWTLAMIVSCFSGFYLKGRLYLTFKATLSHYVKTWFGLDLMLVVSDWALHFLIADASQGYGRFLRFARSARIIRLLRLFKLRGLLHTIEDIIDTENVAIYFQCLKPFIAVGLLTHVLACGWFGIGRWDDSYHHNWVAYSGVLARSKGYQYATSLHWSLAQFTLNTMDVYSHNLGERLYTIFVGLFGIVGFSVLVSGFTSAAEQLREIKSDETKQFWMLRRFFRDYSISHKLASRVMRYCEHTYNESKARIQPEDVSLMKLLSQPLRQELGMELNLPQLPPHPLFFQMEQLRYISLKSICFHLTPRSYARGDSFVTKGEDSVGMIMLTEGEASYTYSDTNCKQCQRLDSGEWLCEPSLWTYWTALGNAKAEVHSRVMVVLADMMERVFSVAPFSEKMYVQRYAQKFVAMLNMLSRDNLTDIIDPVHPSEHHLDALPDHEGRVMEFVKNLGRRLSLTPAPDFSASMSNDQQVVPEVPVHISRNEEAATPEPDPLGSEFDARSNAETVSAASEHLPYPSEHLPYGSPIQL